jgi:hypothetical protein
MRTRVARDLHAMSCAIVGGSMRHSVICRKSCWIRSARFLLLAATMKQKLMPALVAIALAASALDLACGGGVTDDASSADDDAGSDTGVASGDSGSIFDSAAALVDAAKPICPDQWEVYGNTDPSSDLGHVDPRLIASGECHGAFEELSDGGTAPADFSMTMTQSAHGSGMFVTQVTQSIPFALTRTVCLQSSGPNTGSAGYPDDGGQMCLTDVTEDQIPWDPNLVTFTNLEDSDAGAFIVLNQSSDGGSASVTNGWCRWVKN